jgi:phospholipid/cholesterol/gamma-HCH transport system permease protein
MPQSPSSLNRGLSELGGALIERPASWLRVLRFAGVALVTALSPSAWDAGMRRAAAEQIHFSAWQPLPGFTLAAGLLSFVLIRILESTAQAYGLSQYALGLTVRVLVLELIPVLAALFVALRSGAAINTEVALRHIRGDFDTLLRMKQDPLRHDLVPRGIGAVLSVTLLTFLSSAVALALAYLALYGFSPWALEGFVRITGQVFGPVAVAAYALKTLLFGAAVAAIPIVAALAVPREREMAPIAVLRGMVRLGIAIAVIEGGFLAVMYA